jgi:hypothetical protein
MAPAANLSVPPDVSRAVPFGSTPYRENFQPMIAATASIIGCGVSTTS